MTTAKTGLFGRLPGEVRMMIYREVLCVEPHIRLQPRKKSSLDPRTCLAEHTSGICQAAFWQSYSHHGYYSDTRLGFFSGFFGQNRLEVPEGVDVYTWKEQIDNCCKDMYEASNDLMTTSVSANILRVCKLFNSEATSILYGENDFLIPHIILEAAIRCKRTRVFPLFGSVNARLIRRIKFEMDASSVYAFIRSSALDEEISMDWYHFNIAMSRILVNEGLQGLQQITFWRRTLYRKVHWARFEETTFIEPFERGILAIVLQMLVEQLQARWMYPNVDRLSDEHLDQFQDPDVYLGPNQQLTVFVRDGGAVRLAKRKLQLFEQRPKKQRLSTFKFCQRLENNKPDWLTEPYWKWPIYVDRNKDRIIKEVTLRHPVFEAVHKDNAEPKRLKDKPIVGASTT